MGGQRTTGDAEMTLDEIWQAIDEQRVSLADYLDDLSGGDWEVPSLCEAWQVRDVAAHLTLAQMGMLPAAGNMLLAGGSFNRMIRDTALRQASRLPAEAHAAALRVMAGSRRTAPGVTPLEPLIDVLVHGQDIAVPLGRPRPVPPRAAAAAATRVWSMGWPFRARRKLAGFRISATDYPWTAGDGPLVEGPVGAILLLLTGRRAALSSLSVPPGFPLAQPGRP